MINIHSTQVKIVTFLNRSMLYLLTLLLPPIAASQDEACALHFATFPLICWFNAWPTLDTDVGGSIPLQSIRLLIMCVMTQETFVHSHYQETSPSPACFEI
jgi:hypothetical protein